MKTNLIFIAIIGWIACSAQFSYATLLDTIYKGNEISLKQGKLTNVNIALNSPNLEKANIDTGFYTVQFFVTQKKEIADKEIKLIEEILKVTVTIISEPPLYKLRAGKFKTRDEAEKLRIKMTEIGHSSAFITTYKK